MHPMDPRRFTPQQRQAPDDHTVQRYSILGGVLLCSLISGLLGDSLLGVFWIEVGEPIPRAWRWLLGAAEQSFATQTAALLLGVLFLGFGAGGVWFLLLTGLRLLRAQLSGRRPR
jgi:hypothetical protein